MLKVAKHLTAMRTSGMLTESYRQMYRPAAIMVRPQKVIRVLREANIHFVLMGTHGISGYRGARATQDVDVLIRKSDHRRATLAIQQAYPRLTQNDFPPVTRFVDPTSGEAVIDLMKPVDRVYQMVFRNCVSVGDAYHIPTLEMALVSKYAAMISSNRTGGKKHTDAGDFFEIVQRCYDDIDRTKLRKLADLVYQGGGQEILEYVEDARAGRTLRI